MSQLKPGSEREDEILSEGMTQEPAKVVLFNDEVHTFDEVINQIIKATGCALTRAEELTWEVHHNGKAVIYEGEFSKCMSVSSVLEEIALTTQIEV
jgi:ATP-dependent Clp protease adapter protein ClpS